MELRVQLKVCEGCGCLWYRSQTQENVYCNQCERTLCHYPAPGSRKRPGRTSSKPLAEVWAVAEVAGGAH